MLNNQQLWRGYKTEYFCSWLDSP